MEDNSYFHNNIIKCNDIHIFKLKDILLSFSNFLHYLGKVR